MCVTALILARRVLMRRVMRLFGAGLEAGLPETCSLPGSEPATANAALQSDLAGRIRSLLLLVLVIHSAALFVQSALAGEFLSGTDGVVKFHELTAWIILGICAIQFAVAALAHRTGAASLRLLIGTVLIFLAEALQIGTGYGRFLRVHIPLGVLAFAGVSWQWMAQLRQRRSSWKQ